MCPLLSAHGPADVLYTKSLTPQFTPTSVWRSASMRHSSPALSQPAITKTAPEIFISRNVTMSQHPASSPCQIYGMCQVCGWCMADWALIWFATDGVLPAVVWSHICQHRALATIAHPYRWCISHHHHHHHISMPMTDLSPSHICIQDPSVHMLHMLP